MLDRRKALLLLAGAAPASSRDRRIRTNDEQDDGLRFQFSWTSRRDDQAIRLRRQAHPCGQHRLAVRSSHRNSPACNNYGRSFTSGA